jgi:hypothetical protein
LVVTVPPVILWPTAIPPGPDVTLPPHRHFEPLPHLYRVRSGPPNQPELRTDAPALHI